MDIEQNIIMKIAWYYYMENMTQQQISDRLNISRMKVVKYLDMARNQGIIQFKLRSNGERHIKLEQDLMNKYGLTDTYIVPTTWEKT